MPAGDTQASDPARAARSSGGFGRGTMKARSRATRVSGMVSIMLSFGLIVAAVEVGSVHAASTDPAVVGQWTAPTTMPFVGIHSMVMHNGSVLLFDRSLGNRGSPGVLLNPATGAMVDV